MSETEKQRRHAVVRSGPAPKHRAAVLSADHLHRSQWDRLQMLIGDRLGIVAGLAACSTAAAMCEAGILAISAESAAALVSRGHQIPHKLGPLHLNLSIQTLLIVGIALAVIRLILQVPISWLPAVIAGDVQASMRRRLIRAYLYGSWELQSQDREGHFQEMMTNQIMQASQGALQSTQLVTSSFTFMILVGSAFALNVLAAVTVFAMALLIIFLLRPARSTATRLAKMLSAAQLEYAGSVGETNRLTEESNVFGTAQEQVHHVDLFVQRARAYFMKAQLLNRLVPNAYQSLIYFVLVFGLFAAELANVRGFSSLGAVVLLLIRAGTYGQQVQSAQVSLRQSLPFVERLQNVIDGYTASRPTRGTASLKQIRTVAFDQVEYYYARDRPVLRDVRFEVIGGETIGVIGPSGAGKSTLVQILLRLRVPRSGRFLINGIDAAEICTEDWHERVAYVPQQPKLLHATVVDNVRYFRDYDDAAVERACRLARIHDEIMSWPEGYQTIVGPRADAVSGGQQQRICLARALISNPSLLVLDEPTSALDPRSESLIQESLESMRHELTLFIVAHRMSTLSICDRVMVVLDGKLNAFAGLDELRRTNDYYRFASGLRSGTSLAELSAADTPADPAAQGDQPVLEQQMRRRTDQLPQVADLTSMVHWSSNGSSREARQPPLGRQGADARSAPDRDPPPDDKPLFIFSTGCHSNDMLLQRLIVSSGSYFIWAQARHAVDVVRPLAESLPQFGDLASLDGHVRDEIRRTRQSGEDLQPPFTSLLNAHRTFLRELLAPPAESASRGWGLTEIALPARYAQYLRLLFPHSRVIFLVENPHVGYRSYRDRPTWFERWPRSQVRTPSAYGQGWRRLADSFLEGERSLGATLLRYEDLLHGGEALARLERVIGAAVDHSLLSAHPKATMRSEKGGPSGLELRMLDRATAPTAERLGYGRSAVS